jgi:hypothetical protein
MAKEYHVEMLGVAGVVMYLMHWLFYSNVALTLLFHIAFIGAGVSAYVLERSPMGAVEKLSLS